MAEKPASRFPLLFALICVIFAVAAGMFIFKPWEKPGTTIELGRITPIGGEEKPPESNANPDLSISDKGLSKAKATVATDKGEIVFHFYPEDAPNTVGRMIELINQGYYNGLRFHRVMPNFIIQTGDPSGSGNGGSGTTLKAEFNSRPHMDGAVGLAHGSNPDSGDSQFYITIGQQASLNGRYTVFGLVTEGMDVARKIKQGDRVKWITIE